jgi:peptidoglycan-N-acetylglucosamine deacetylase
VRKTRTLFSGCATLALSAAMAAAAPQLAITFDDLPVHGPLPPGLTRVEIAKQITTALKKAHVPPTYGFVNGVGIAAEPESAPFLKIWRDAGDLLGNHTWSHMNLSQHTVEDYETEIVRNEPLLEETMPGADWRWFRYPYLAEGETPEKRATIRQFLASRGYRIAGVTMSFGDWLYSKPYARCVAKRDKGAIATMEKDYLNAAAENVAFSRHASRTLYDRDIPYVLLMHVGAFEAHTLPKLLALYRAKGFKFVSLEQAESDPYYKAIRDPGEPAGSTGLEEDLSKRPDPIPKRTDYGPYLKDVCR